MTGSGDCTIVQIRAGDRLPPLFVVYSLVLTVRHCYLLSLTGTNLGCRTIR